MKLPLHGSSTPDPDRRQWLSLRTIRLVLILVASLAMGVGSLYFGPVSAVTVAMGTAAAFDQIVRQLPRSR